MSKDGGYIQDSILSLLLPKKCPYAAKAMINAIPRGSALIPSFTHWSMAGKPWIYRQIWNVQRKHRSLTCMKMGNLCETPGFLSTLQDDYMNTYLSLCIACQNCHVIRTVHTVYELRRCSAELPNRFMDHTIPRMYPSISINPFGNQ